MTRDHDFKQIVRDRMARTGESYAAARSQVLGADRAPDGDHRPEPGPAGVLTIAEVVTLAENEVDLDWAREVREVGCPFTVEELVELHEHDLDVDALRWLVAERAEVSFDDVRRLAETGWARPDPARTPEDLRLLADHDVDPAWVASMEVALGARPDAAELVALHEAGVEPAVPAAFRSGGRSVTVAQLVQLSEAGLDAELADALVDAGLVDLKVSDMVSLVEHGADLGQVARAIGVRPASAARARTRVIEGFHPGDLRVDGHIRCDGTIGGTVTVVTGGVFELQGTVLKDLVVERRGAANVRGTVAGAVFNDGGALSITGVAREAEPPPRPE